MATVTLTRNDTGPDVVTYRLEAFGFDTDQAGALAPGDSVELNLEPDCILTIEQDTSGGEVNADLFDQDGEERE